MSKAENMEIRAEAAAALREGGLRPTRTRCLILALLRQGSDHPTAAQITSRLNATGEHVHLPTVYQCLDRMVQAGLLSSFVDGDGLIHFDVNPRPHHHLRCMHCGVIVDALITAAGAGLLEALSRTASKLEPTQSWAITNAKVELQGLCPSCRPRNHTGAEGDGRANQTSD